MSKNGRFIIALSAFVLLVAFADCAAAADGDMVPERFERIFGTAEFKLNRDAMKQEQPEQGKYKITPRMKNVAVWTRYELPDSVGQYREWMVKANVYSSQGPGAGVAMWSEQNGYAAYVYPDGSGVFAYYEDKKPSWVQKFNLKNFAFPAAITIVRDTNGSVVARVNDVIVSTRLLEVDFKKPKLDGITAVSFATHSSEKSAQQPAVYENLEVQAWGYKAPESLFDNL